MKRIYLFSLMAACLAPSAVKAQNSCDTAIPYTGMVMGSTLTGETWYTLTVTEISMFPSNVVTEDQAEIVIYEDCDGEEAAPNGTNCYFLFPETVYKVKVTPKENVAGMLLMGAMDLSHAPQGMYPVNPIALPGPDDENYGAAVKQATGRTLWYERVMGVNGKISFTKDGMNPVSNLLTRVEVKRGLKGVSNIAEQEIIGGWYVMAPSPFAKAGTNLIAITTAASEDPEETEVQFQFSTLGMPNCDCDNRIERATEITAGSDFGLTNGYYVADRTFVPETSGTYSFVITAAEGTVINVGKVIDTGEVRYPGEEYEAPIYACEYDSDPVVVGASHTACIAFEAEAGQKYVLHYDADYALEDGEPSMKVAEGDLTGVNQATVAASDLWVSENPTDGDLTVKSGLLEHGAEIALFDMSAKKVFGQKVKASNATADIRLTGVKQGTYLLVVFGQNRSASTKLIVK